MRSGQRPFPWLEESVDFPFPDVETASPEGVVCQGGNLSPGMLLSAYRRGIFPWYGPGEPLLWWSPDPRFVLFPDEAHISATSRKLIRHGRYSLAIDTDFPAVIQACASTPRPGQPGTWIVPDMIEAYTGLHELGLAHSVEAREDGVLVGGLYGVSLGKAFFGESMFSLADGASRFSFLCLAMRLSDEGYSLIDSQVYTDYLADMGAREIPRGEYLRRLGDAMRSPDRRGSWTQAFPGFPRSAGYDRILNTGAHAKAASPDQSMDSGTR
ncbi:MAG: leucyl/phenylalanyl-tRNA--protein transferase [Rectinemataceae bacterium]